MEYRLYLLNELGKIVLSHDVNCGDDNLAYITALKFLNDKPFEIWAGTRRIYPALSESFPASPTESSNKAAV